MKEQEERTLSRQGLAWAGASLLLALVASIVMLLAPLGTEVESTAQSPAAGSVQPAETKVTHPSLLQIQGWSVAIPLGIPVVLAGAGVLAALRRARRWLISITVVMGAFVVLGALSVGVFYLPAEAAMIVAGVRLRRP